MNKTFRIIYSLTILVLVVMYGYNHFESEVYDQEATLLFPFITCLIMIAGFFCVFLVKALFSGGFEIVDFLELVGAFLILLIVQNASENRLVFIGLLAILLVISILKLSKKTKEILE